METLVEQIDQLESQIIDLIDDLEFYSYSGSIEEYAIRAEIDKKRNELLMLKMYFDKTSGYDLDQWDHQLL